MMITALAPLILAPGLIVIPANAWPQWSKCNSGTLVSSECNDTTSETIEYVMFGIGIGSVVFNGVFVACYNIILMGGCNQMRMYPINMP